MNENLNRLIALKKEFWHKHSSNPWESYEKSVEIQNVQKALKREGYNEDIITAVGFWAKNPANLPKSNNAFLREAPKMNIKKIHPARNINVTILAEEEF